MSHILLVEDSPLQSRALLSYFELTEYELVHTERLTDALEQMQRIELDAVILDLALPDSVGVATYRRVREVAPQLPVVVLTSTDDEDLALQLLREGAQDYLIKDEVNSDWVRRSLRYAIERNSAENARPTAQNASRHPAAVPHSLLNCEVIEGVTIVRIQESRLTDGELIRQFSADMDRQQGEHKHLVIDCRQVEYLANSVLIELREWDRMLRKQGGGIRICNLGSAVRDQIRMRKMLAQFDVCIDEETALAAITR